MIKYVHLDTSPIRVGDQRWLSAEGDEPFAVEIKCFVSNPPPGGYKPCAECGRFDITEGQAVLITASPAVFQNNQGVLEIGVTDQTGDSKLFRLIVVAQIVPITSTLPSPAPASGGSTATA